MQVVEALVVAGESAAEKQPRKGPFDHSAMTAELLARLEAFAGDPAEDPASTERGTTAPTIVGLVPVQLARTTAWATTAGTLDRLYLFKDVFEHGAVWDSGGREVDGQRDAAPV